MFDFLCVFLFSFKGHYLALFLAFLWNALFEYSPDNIIFLTQYALLNLVSTSSIPYFWVASSILFLSILMPDMCNSPKWYVNNLPITCYFMFVVAALSHIQFVVYACALIACMYIVFHLKRAYRRYKEIWLLMVFETIRGALFKDPLSYAFLGISRYLPILLSKLSLLGLSTRQMKSICLIASLVTWIITWPYIYSQPWLNWGMVFCYSYPLNSFVIYICQNAYVTDKIQKWYGGAPVANATKDFLLNLG